LVVSFVLLPIVVSIFVFGSLIHLYIASQAAAASGAREAASVGGWTAAVATDVQRDLQSNGVSGVRCGVAASAISVSLGQPIAITVSCPQQVGIPFFFEQSVDVSSTFVAYGEVNQ
jgi:hypothetical protein